MTRWLLAASTTLSLMLILAFAGCGGDDDAESTAEKEPSIYDDPKYADWLFHECGLVKFYYPPGHPQSDQFDQRCDMYNRSINDICEILNMQRPWDTLVVFTYTGFGQGRELTGREYPFTTDSIIHFWLPSYIGPTLTDWLLPKWISVEPKYPMWRHGLRSLFDFSGQNYHRVVFHLKNDDRYVPLSKLPGDTAIDSNVERNQSAEAASLAAFILAQYGPNKLRNVYRSRLEFGQMVLREFGMTVDSLEQAWLSFARTNVPDSVLESYENID
ncbi:hypothetical protein GF420_12330 [candidate division GN15 bacterium]|nr:hypothetical protein [candidate division GN15 bacterium]